MRANKTTHLQIKHRLCVKKKGMRRFCNVNDVENHVFVGMNRRICSLISVNIKFFYVCVGIHKSYLGNQTYTSEQNRCIRQKTYVGVKISTYPHAKRTFTSTKRQCVCVSAMLLSREPTHAHLLKGGHKSNLAKWRIFLKKNMALSHPVDMDVKHMYALVFGMNTMEKQTFPHVQKRCLRRNTYACARQHRIYIRKRTLTHVQKRCLRWNTKHINRKTHISACSNICLRRNTYVYVWQHNIYITKRTLTHVQKRCLRCNTKHIHHKTHISACSNRCLRRKTYVYAW